MVHRLNQAGIVKAREMARAFDELTDLLGNMVLADCAEFTICKRKLEEACFYAKKSMALNPKFQETNND